VVLAVMAVVTVVTVVVVVVVVVEVIAPLHHGPRGPLRSAVMEAAPPVL
jgi:hypothetical protein